jgi:hypothetical protein
MNLTTEPTNIKNKYISKKRFNLNFFLRGNGIQTGQESHDVSIFYVISRDNYAGGNLIFFLVSEGFF